jgi:hypothetical protein
MACQKASSLDRMLSSRAVSWLLGSCGPSFREPDTASEVEARVWWKRRNGSLDDALDRGRLTKNGRGQTGRGSSRPVASDTKARSSWCEHDAHRMAVIGNDCGGPRTRCRRMTGAAGGRKTEVWEHLRRKSLQTRQTGVPDAPSRPTEYQTGRFAPRPPAHMIFSPRFFDQFTAMSTSRPGYLLSALCLYRIHPPSDFLSQSDAP